MEQHTTHNDLDGQADIFDMAAHHKPQRDDGPVPPPTVNPSTDHKPELLDRLVKMSPRHLAMITAAIICVGLAWSRLTAHDPTPSGGDNQLLPTDYQQLSTPAAPERTPPAPPPRPAPESAPRGETQQPAPPKEESERAIIRTALEDLNARVAKLEAEPREASASTVAPAPPTAKAESQRLARTPATKTRHPAERTDALPVLAGYSLNTVYQNQAWIEHDGTTYAVQVGDKIGAIPITGIDARARRVVTPNGQIR